MVALRTKFVEPLLKVKVKVTQLCPTLRDPMDCTAHWNSPGQNTGVGSLFLLQWIFLTQESIQIESDPALQADSVPTELSEIHF